MEGEEEEEEEEEEGGEVVVVALISWRAHHRPPQVPGMRRAAAERQAETKRLDGLKLKGLPTAGPGSAQACSARCYNNAVQEGARASVCGMMAMLRWRYVQLR